MFEIIFTLSMVFFLGMFLILAATVLFSGIFFVKERKQRKQAKSSSQGTDFTPPVSVVIPAYNEGRRIGTCLEAIFSSEYPGDVEVIVVDDGSTDNTIAIARKHPCTVLKGNHEGKVAALNRGVSHARHDFVLTIDADTFLEKNTIKEIVLPFKNSEIGAVSGLTNVQNNKGIWGAFQSVEYPYISFLREVFSSLFRVTPGICGAFTCFKKSVLQKIGGFKKNTASEDFDIPFHIVKAGYGIAFAPRAVSYTIVPSTFASLFKQRIRWIRGITQSIIGHRGFLKGRKLSVNYLLGAQMFWFLYAFFALPLMLFHIVYWLPANSATLFDLSFYLFRWMSLAGVVYMIYMIPQWGVNWVYMFGVLAGIISSLFFLLSIIRYDKLRLGNVLAIFFFFPYTLVMSVFMIGGILSFFATKGKGTFIH